MNGPRVSPTVRLGFLTSEEWEEFIEEWAIAISRDPTLAYIGVERLGGAGDKGADIVCFTDADGFFGIWDCYQGKRYHRSLQPGDAFPEMLKTMRAVLTGSYVMPRSYFFAAPRGCGTKLTYMLDTPGKAKTAFQAYLDDPVKQALHSIGAQELVELRQLVTTTDFAAFKTTTVRTMLDQHSTSPYHWARFGGGLPHRPPAEPVPVFDPPLEQRYVGELLRAYEEVHGPGLSTYAAASADNKTSDHLREQREAFFAAEALSRYARDEVPLGTYDELKNDSYEVVIDTVRAPHPSGLERLRHAVDKAHAAQLVNALITVARPQDRRGICHQLVNDERVRWVS